MSAFIIGAVTREKLESWLAEHRPELVLHERDRATRGFYPRDNTPARSFQVCGPTWRDVAARLRAIEVPDA